jgi:hypothetical protein
MLDGSTTVRLDEKGLAKLLAAAETKTPIGGAHDAAKFNGLGIAGAISRDVKHLTHQSGHPALKRTGKANKGAPLWPRPSCGSYGPTSRALRRPGAAALRALRHQAW